MAGTARGSDGHSMSAALLSMPSIAKRMLQREPDALAAREVDSLVWKLLGEIKVPFESLKGKVLNHLTDLKKILSTDYMDVPALPSKPLVKELARIVETDIKQHIPSYGTLADLDSEHLKGHLEKLFGPRELELRAERYETGAGMSLRGFYCRADVGEKRKFVIFVNTAHHPGAVGATLGHELGHFIYGSLVGEKAAHTAFMEGAFAKHLVEEDELFADSLVALAAYSAEMIKKLGGITHIKRGSPDNLVNSLKWAYQKIGTTYDLDLTKGGKMGDWRVRYLTSMAHFFKLRGALYKSAGV